MSHDCFDGLCEHPDCRECSPCLCGESVESCVCSDETELREMVKDSVFAILGYVPRPFTKPRPPIRFIQPPPKEEAQ